MSDRARSRERPRSIERRRSRSGGRHGGARRRSATPPAAPRQQANPRMVAWSRENMQHLTISALEVVKLVEVERMLIAYNRATPAIQRGDLAPLTVLQGLLLTFRYRDDYHLGSVLNYAVKEGEDHVLVQANLPSGDSTPLIPIVSVSKSNLLDESEWEGSGREELARLHEVYLRRHAGRGLPLDQAAAAAWRRKAALDWYKANRADEAGLAPHLPGLIEDLRDRRQQERQERSFEVERVPEVERRTVESPRVQRQRGDRSPPAQQRPRQQQQERGQEQAPGAVPPARAEERARRRAEVSPPPVRQRQEQRGRGEAEAVRPPSSRGQGQVKKGEEKQVQPRQAKQQLSQAQAALSASAASALAASQQATAGTAGAQQDADLPPHLAARQHMQDTAQQAATLQQQAQHAVLIAATQASGAELPLPPHLMPGAVQPKLEPFDTVPAVGLGAAQPVAAPTVHLKQEPRDDAVRIADAAAPTFISLEAFSADGRDAAAQAERRAQAAGERQRHHHQQQQQQQQPVGPRLAADDSRDLRAARAAATAAQHDFDSKQRPSSALSKAASMGQPPLAASGDAGSQRPAAATGLVSVQGTAAAGGSAAADAAPRAASDWEASPAGPAGGKRKRPVIQWQAQEAKPGDVPLLPGGNAVLAAATKGHSPAPAGKASLAAAAEPASKGKEHKGETAGQPKGKQAAGAAAAAAAQPSKGKHAAADKPPKSFSITVRNTPLPAREGSPMEEGEVLPPAKLPRQDSKGGGTSRLAVAASNPHLHTAAAAPAATAASWASFPQQQQQQQQQPPGHAHQQHLQHKQPEQHVASGKVAPGAPFFSRGSGESALAPDGLPAFPPGFGGGGNGGRHTPVSPGMRAVGASATGGSDENLTVRVMVQPPEAGDYEAYANGALQLQQQQQALHDSLASQQQYAQGGAGAAAGYVQTPAPGYGDGALHSGAPAFSDYLNRYAPAVAAAAATLAPSPTEQHNFYLAAVAAQQAQQQQLQQLAGQQQQQLQYVSYSGLPGELPTGFDGSGGYAAAAAEDMQPGRHAGGSALEFSVGELGSERHQGRSRSKSGGRLVQLEQHGEGASKGGDGGRQGRRATGAAGSGGSGGGVGGPACWDPVAVWETRLVSALKAQPGGISVEELHKRLPLPPFMAQDLDSYSQHLAYHKELCAVQRAERSLGASLVQSVPNGEAWVAFKRELLQVLADRRPRLELSIVQHLLPDASRLAGHMRDLVKRNLEGFCVKFLREEVACVHAKGQTLLELRPFAKAEGLPPPPHFGDKCGRFFSGSCKFGAQCYNAHAPPRRYMRH